MAKKPPLDFYEIQSKQRKKSVFLILFLFLFYFFAIGFISVVFVVSFGLILSKETLLSADFLRKLLLFDAAVSIIIATFHYVDARRFGAKFILKRLDAVLDRTWLRKEVRSLYDKRTGRPGIDPEAAVRLMLAGLFQGITSDRKLMREAQANLAIQANPTAAVMNLKRLAAFCPALTGFSYGDMHGTSTAISIRIDLGPPNEARRAA